MSDLVLKIVEIFVVSGFGLYVVQSIRSLSVAVAKLQGSQDVLMAMLDDVKRMGVIEAKADAAHRRLDEHREVSHT